MQQKVSAVVFTLLALLVPAGMPLGLAQDGPVPASSQESAKSAQSEGCKPGPHTGTTPLNHLPNYFTGEEDLRGGMTCAFRINFKLPLFIFHLSGQEDNTFGNLEITVGASNEVIQVIENTTDPSAIVPGKVQSVLTTVDANFDGYQDLRLLSQCGATGNCSYDFYLYDPKANQFVHNDFLSNLATPSFDQAKKQVTTSSNSSASDWRNETYQYGHGGHYTLIHREESTWDRNHNTVTVSTYELRNGRMELVHSKITPE
jgi:hypothetical protein